MVSKDIVVGVNFHNVDSFVCEPCMYGKQHRVPFAKGEHRKMKIGELVHSDVCGPFSTPSVNGARYFVLFKDDYSSFKTVYFLRHKSDVLDRFKVFNELVKNKFGHYVKILKSDTL